MFRHHLPAFLYAAAIAHAATVPLGDWPDWRGPNHDGASQEKGLPEKWSLKGQNLAWKAPYGGRSAPIVMGDHLYLLNSAGKGETLQERLMCFNADTGKVLWEHRFNVYQSDVPPHRIGWAAPVGDPATGNVYALGGGGNLVGFSRDGKQLWQRSLGEDFDLFTTHGGRTVSPIIDGDLVLLSAASSTWGTMGNRAIRFMAFDKHTGDTVWVASPPGRPYDTTYAQPRIADVNGTRLLISGSGDGAIHAMKAQTGELVWDFPVSRRAINTGIIMNGNTAIISHGQENLAGNVMGLLVAFDVTGKGMLGKDRIKWSVPGFMGEFSSGVIDGDRYVQIDNGSNIHAFDVTTGRELWKQSLGTVQKASLVLGDGKLYVGTESGKFYIMRPHSDRCQILSEQEMPISATGIASEKIPEPILASAAISRGRVFFVSTDGLYAIGQKKNTSGTVTVDAPRQGSGPAAWVQVSPTELFAAPGQTLNFKVRLFDQKGDFLSESKAEWSLEGLKGTVADGKFTVSSDKLPQAGLVKATVGSLSGAARVRVVPPLPLTESFDSYAVGSAPPGWAGVQAGKFTVQDLEGNKVLAKAPDETLFKRMRVFLGPPTWSNYTVEADVRAPEKRRQLGDIGVTAQRYTLVLFGNAQRMELFSWQPETARTVTAPFAWKPDTWYRMKLRVENMDGGKTRVRGKAWPRDAAEPQAWLIDRTDPIGNREGSPGLFGDATYGLFFDNLKISPNQ